MTATRARVAPAPERAPEPRPDLTVVRKRRARRSMLTRLGTVMLFSLFIAVLGVVVFQTLRVQNQAKLDDIDKRIAVQEDRSKTLRLQLADAMAPDKIANTARTRLGMIQPNGIAYLQPKPDDEARAVWDPSKEPLPAPPTTAPPVTAPPTTLAPVPSTVPRAASGTPSGAATSPSPKASTTPTTTATTKAATTPSTKAPTTPTTKAPATPTTAKPAAAKR